MARTRIPDTISGFNKYINSTDKYQLAIDSSSLIPNWQRLSLTAAESGNWSAKRAYWRDILYKKYSDKNTSTSVIKKGVKKFMKEFRAFANPLLNRMTASAAATSADEAAFNFVITPGKSTRRGKIDDVPFIKLTAMGGGEMKFGARTSEDISRPSRHSLADGLEIRWMIMIAPQNHESPNVPGIPAAKVVLPPSTADECPNNAISTKAIFRKAFGQINQNKMLYCFIRWVNLVKPENNGPWSNRFESGIL